MKTQNTFSPELKSSKMTVANSKMGGGGIHLNLDSLKKKPKRRRTLQNILSAMAITIGLFVTTSTSAQFTNAVIADNVYSLTTYPSIVNNDILDDGNNTYRVTAFSDAVGPRSGIMWECFFCRQ